MTQLEAFLYVMGIGLAICAFLGVGILVLYLNSPDRPKVQAVPPKGERRPAEVSA